MRFKKKKTRKFRGSTFHGWGKGAAHHKGAGNRGGRGRSGSGKRADQKKPSYWKEPLANRGFSSKNRFEINAINIADIIRDLDYLVETGIAQKSHSGYEVDLTKSRYNKLLATSAEFKEKLTITVDFASKSAVEKVKSAGGEVKVLKVKAKKEKKKAAKPVKKEESAGTAGKKGASKEASEDQE